MEAIIYNIEDNQYPCIISLTSIRNFCNSCTPRKSYMEFIEWLKNISSSKEEISFETIEELSLLLKEGIYIGCKKYPEKCKKEISFDTIFDNILNAGTINKLLRQIIDSLPTNKNEGDIKKKVP